MHFKKYSQREEKQIKKWVDKGSEFYNNSFKSFLKINNIEMYSTYNEGKSVVAKRFIRTLKNNIFKHMTAISKDVYFDVLDDIANKYNNTVCKTIKMKPIDVTDNSYAEYNKDFNKKDPTVFVIRKITNAVPWTHAVSDLNGEKSTGSFYEKELQKPSQEKFSIKKVLKRKGDKLYVKCKGYDNRFNSWINK